VGLTESQAKEKYPDMRVECFPWVTNPITECTLAMGNELTSDEIIETIHTHPILSESLSKIVLAAEGRPIHIPPK
jgi:dihydrolipoamide dehydrogenase